MHVLTQITDTLTVLDHGRVIANGSPVAGPRRSARSSRRISERSGPHVLSVRSLEVRYGGLRAVDAVSLDVSEGGMVAVIGPNGAGKSSLFNAISGTAPVHGGERSGSTDAICWP